MWAEILTNDKVVVKVRKEDINIFLKEIETRNDVIRWITNLKPTEALTNPVLNRNAHSKEHCYFYLESNCRLWYDTYLQDNHKDFIQIDYLPPMRWDLFKKGRRIIRVTPDKLDEFMKKCSIKLGGIMMPNLKRYKEFTHVFVMISDYHYDNKPTIHIMTPEDLVRNQHENPKKYSDKKIVDWEDVR